MAQRGKQMTAGASEDFAYYYVKLVLMANVNKYEVYSNTFFLVLKPHMPNPFTTMTTDPFFQIHITNLYL